jgi:hypothetical protein
MDFNSHSSQPVANPGIRSHSEAPAPKPSKKRMADTWSRLAVTVVVACVVILLIGIVALIFANNNNNNNQNKYIDTSKLQAVFLNTGQVYFGHISTLNNSYMVLTGIFYLQTNSSSSSTTSTTNASNVSLVKLGCELHRPYDQMIINGSEVTFWENLQSDGQVAKAVATWNSEHPNGQQCTDQSSSSSTSSTSNVQNANNKQ